MDDLVAILGVICIFGWPIALIGLLAFRSFLKHQQQMLERKLAAHSEASSQVQAQLAAVRRELAELRDTATQFEMSIQGAVEQLQGRMERVEGRAGFMKAAEPSATAAQPETIAAVGRAGFGRESA